MPGPRLPPEISDCIIDLLSKEREVLKRCCLVSKSWVPRTRRYLFGWVEFVNPDDIDAWKETFPDPDNSPACHTHSLFVNCVEFITAAIVEEGSWMRAFHNVWRLEIFNEFTYLSPSEFMILICSLPLLEDLRMGCLGVNNSYDSNSVTWPSILPPLTGTLSLSLPGGMEYTIPHVLGLQVFCRFRSLKCTVSYEEDFQCITALIEECSDALKYVFIEDSSAEHSWEASADLSRAKGLEEAGFHFGGFSVAWVAMALKTITHKHRDFCVVSIRSYALSNYFNRRIDARTVVGDELYEHWMDLDRTLTQLWESHAIYVRIEYLAGGREKRAHKFVGGLLPEATERGMVELVNLAHPTYTVL